MPSDRPIDVFSPHLRPARVAAMPPDISPRSGQYRAYPWRPVHLIPPSTDTAYLHSTQVMHPMRRTNALPLSDGSNEASRPSTGEAPRKL